MVGKRASAIAPTPEQRGIVNEALADLRSGEDEVRIAGLAGTGKSTVAVELLRRLPGRLWAVAAPTGKAAHVLRRKGVPHASTIHSLIYHPYKDEKGRIRFRRKESLDIDGVLIDEASMVGPSLYDDLRSYGVPLILIGDHGQLPPVDPRAQSRSLMEDAHYRLTTIHRNAGDIVRFAHIIREGKWDEVRRFQSEDGSVRALSRDAVDADLLCTVDQVCCAFNATRIKMNREIRTERGSCGDVEVGDRVMCLRNNYDRGLFNGMQADVLSVGTTVDRDKDIPAFTLRDDDGQTYHDVPYVPEQFNSPPSERTPWRPDGPIPFDYAYCVTGHKCQGSEYDDVLVLFEEYAIRRFGKFDVDRWGYTAATRAKRLLIWAS